MPMRIPANLQRPVAAVSLFAFAPWFVVIGIFLKLKRRAAFDRGDDGYGTLRFNVGSDTVLHRNYLDELPSLVDIVRGKANFGQATPRNRVARLCGSHAHQQLNEIIVKMQMGVGFKGLDDAEAYSAVRFAVLYAEALYRAARADERHSWGDRLDALGITEEDIADAVDLLPTMDAMYESGCREARARQRSNSDAQHRPARDNLHLVADRTRARSRGPKSVSCSRVKGSRRVASRSAGGGSDGESSGGSSDPPKPQDHTEAVRP